MQEKNKPTGGTAGKTSKGEQMQDKDTPFQPTFDADVLADEATDAAMWESNIEVDAEGRAASVVRFTGGVFASNKVVADAQESISDQVQRLRFKKVKYLWIPSASECQLYTIESKADGYL